MKIWVGLLRVHALGSLPTVATAHMDRLAQATLEGLREVGSGRSPGQDDEVDKEGSLVGSR